MKHLRVTNQCNDCDIACKPLINNKQHKDIMVVFDRPETDSNTGGKYEKWFMAQAKEAGLNVNNIHVTYRIACFTDGKNDIENAAKLCKLGLDIEIDNINPMVIIACDDARLAFDINEDIHKVRGSVYTYRDYPVIPVVNPMYIIRGNNQELVTFYSDLNKALLIASGNYKAFNPDYYIEDDFDRLTLIVNNYAEHKTTMSCDIESTSLDPRKAKLICVGFSLAQQGFVIPFMKNGNVLETSKHIKARNLVQKMLDNCRLVFHNASFDVSVLISLGFKVDKNNIEDTMLMHHTYHPELPHDLGYVTSCHGMVPYWKGVVLNNKNSMANIEDSILRKYNALDCMATYQVYTELDKLLKEEGLFEIYNDIAKKLIYPTVMMKLNGMKLIPSKIGNWKKEVADKLIEAKFNFKFITGTTESFNPNSMYHVGMLFFGKKPKSYYTDMEVLSKYNDNPKLKRDTIKYKTIIDNIETIDSIKPITMPKGALQNTAKGNPDTSKKAITRIIMLAQARVEQISHFKKLTDAILAEKSKLELAIKTLQAFLNYKLWLKLQTTYTEFATGADGRIHPGYKIHGTRTGRLASNGPNWQNLPKAVKVLFGPNEGNVIISADFSNIEMRVLAYETNDDILQEIFDSGKKVHDENVKVMFGLDSSHEGFEVAKRAAKTYIFGRNYGGSVKGIYERLIIQVPELKLSYEEFVRIDEAYREKHPAYVNWVNEMQEQANHRFVINGFGRKRYFLDSMDKVKREILNTPMQSTAADCFNLALIEVQDWIDTCKLKKKPMLIGAVHDSIVIECSIEDMEIAADTLKAIMEKKRFYPKWNKHVSFPVDVEICFDNWAEGVKLAKATELRKDYINDDNSKRTKQGHRINRDSSDEWDKWTIYAEEDDEQ